MHFNWINLANALIILIMLAPNLLFLPKVRVKTSSHGGILAVLEQVGRYGSMIFMLLPLGVRRWEFGFGSGEEMIIWVIACLLLLTAYIVCWMFYPAHQTFGLALALTVLPCTVFMLTGVFLRHPLLFGFALLFFVTHILAVYKNFSQA